MFQISSMSRALPNPTPKQQEEALRRHKINLCTAPTEDVDESDEMLRQIEDFAHGLFYDEEQPPPSEDYHNLSNSEGSCIELPKGCGGQ